MDDPVGEIGDVTGVVEAMVLPMPVRKVGETMLSLAVMEHALGGTEVLGEMRAGLWGEPMAMTKGMLELDAMLGRRDGATGPELAEFSRDRNCKGAGTAESAAELLKCLSCS